LDISHVYIESGARGPKKYTFAIKKRKEVGLPGVQQRHKGKGLQEERVVPSRHAVTKFGEKSIATGLKRLT